MNTQNICELLERLARSTEYFNKKILILMIGTFVFASMSLFTTFLPPTTELAKIWIVSGGFGFYLLVAIYVIFVK